MLTTIPPTQLPSFACGYPVVLTSFMESHVFLFVFNVYFVFLLMRRSLLGMVGEVPGFNNRDLYSESLSHRSYWFDAKVTNRNKSWFLSSGRDENRNQVPSISHIHV
jgi:hypothetical protein